MKPILANNARIYQFLFTSTYVVFAFVVPPPNTPTAFCHAQNAPSRKWSLHTTPSTDRKWKFSLQMASHNDHTHHRNIDKNTTKHKKNRTQNNNTHRALENKLQPSHALHATTTTTAGTTATTTTTALRRYLLHYHTVLPVLYADPTDICASHITIEHVVPVSILRNSMNPHAANDPANVHLSLGSINHARSNFRFCFSVANKSIDSIFHESNSTVLHIGYGNCIDKTNRLFYPRIQDIPLIARTILHMHRKWMFDLNDVTTATAQELCAITALSHPTNEERLHCMLTQAIQIGIVKI